MQEYQPPAGEVLKLLEARWGSVDKFTATFNAAAAGVQVGWRFQGLPVG
jgi:superoxide dismutase